MKRYLTLCIAFVIALSSCQGNSVGTASKGENIPQFINHPKPDLALDFSAFEDLGCSEAQADLHDCETNSALIEFMCDEIRKPSNLLGALDPPHPIAKCLVMPDRYHSDPEAQEARILPEGEYFFLTGGLFRIYVRYVIFRDNQFELVENVEEFRSIFAPIKSPEEALSYALAVKDLTAYYGRKHAPHLDYFVEEIEDTYVETTSEGYLVHLFDYQQYGCGPHFTYSKELLVTEEGFFEIAQSEEIFKDPEEDDLCAD